MKARRQSLTVEPLEDRTMLSTCNVTRLSDTGIGNGFSGDLRYCITKANDNPGPDDIEITVTGTVNLNQPLPALSTDLNIFGPGPGRLTVRRNTGEFRVFSVGAGAVVRLLGMSIKDGIARNDVGGGISNAGDLTLIHVQLQGNKSQHDAGPGIAQGGGVHNAGALTIQNSVIKSNYALKNSNLNQVVYAFGAGIYNASGSTAYISNSSISSNFLEARENTGFPYGYGAGLYNALGATVVLAGTKVESNIAQAWANYYEVYASGGGIYNEGDATIRRSTIAGNQAIAAYTESYPYATGAGIHNRGTVRLVDSTVSNNFIPYYCNCEVPSGRGAGLYHSGGKASVFNSTVAQNSLQTDPAQGSGIWASAEISIRHSTITANSGAYAVGSGIYISGNPKVLIRNSIIAKNTSSNIAGAYIGDHNLVGGEPRLGPLQHNGGPTKTAALLPGSLAIDAGDNTDAPEFDQRGPGFARVVNGTIDIGAFEAQFTAAPHPPVFLAFLITADSDPDEWEIIQ